MTPTHYGQLLPEGRWTHNPTALIHHFLATHTTPEQDARILTNDLYAVYAAWCVEHGEQTASRQLFGRQVRAAGIATGRSHGQRYYLNVRALHPSFHLNRVTDRCQGVTEGDR